MSYALRESLPTPKEFVALREAAGMTSRTLKAAERGLPNSCYGVTVVHDGDVVGMGRIVGDGATVLQLTDIAVHPDHQGRGLGTEITQALVDWLHENAPPSAYVNLVADVDGFYEQFGFEPTAPASKGMYLRIE
ncbi:Acetyltransferase (GNAT) domain-containing protein [Halogranum amylolyticum]|uniref:Acetyltransferase (GNAT) domain-containing protein n=1 Tax=Halogranum amylolyticum TaxID=660520 RepID=A0A1H8P0R9_9EURY|nr:GNAT family N-acetyltransferase [Halogranum amylolyticum]SEO35457.1 Acetyltransferase (GNAT) domain-containing protein [Halogranum amylolyticum]